MNNTLTFSTVTPLGGRLPQPTIRAESCRKVLVITATLGQRAGLSLATDSRRDWQDRVQLGRGDFRKSGSWSLATRWVYSKGLIPGRPVN